MSQACLHATHVRVSSHTFNQLNNTTEADMEKGLFMRHHYQSGSGLGGLGSVAAPASIFVVVFFFLGGGILQMGGGKTFFRGGKTLKKVFGFDHFRGARPSKSHQFWLFCTRIFSWFFHRKLGGGKVWGKTILGENLPPLHPPGAATA